ncbi:MAG: saccharopine dehydrogenase NADP-binding domain-containing protein [Parvularculaceae bacterium]|nr:saccharopine dehydrogenase NADP-binding domain-containing protein [Parvularculaceae bacterium]
MGAREFDIIVYGASGYTGRLVAEYLASEYGGDATLKWAVAGRSAAKLKEVMAQIGAPASVPVIAADASDPASIKAMAARAKCVITTVGPYQLYGEPLVAACAETGTDYVDLCGEPNWMRAMIDKYEAAAKKSGARIVFSCGFDSIPFDLGVWRTQEEAKKEFGAPCLEIKGRVRAMKGKFSGGTAASLKATMAAAFKDPSVIELLKSPFALTPGFIGAEQPSMSKPTLDEATGVWLAPFVMAPINTKNVHRSNFLMGCPYGRDFRYSEMMMTGKGEQGEAIAKAVASDTTLMSEDAPKPGEGPTREERETGFYDILFIGETARGEKIRTHCKGDKDPGYGSTSKMIAESAITLVRDARETKGGVWTPAAAMAAPLSKRLQAKAGLTFGRE